jgi:hypothetical protein
MLTSLPENRSNPFCEEIASKISHRKLELQTSAVWHKKLKL